MKPLNDPVRNFNIVCCLVMSVFLVINILIGPACLAYDINTLGNSRQVSMFEPAVFLCGMLFFEIAVPLAMILWLCSSVGIL